MSNANLPSLPGLTWSVFKAPMFNTKIQTSVNLSELRASFAATPIYKVKLSYDVLRDAPAYDELRELGGFFMERQGRFDSWLYTDPSDNAVSAQLIGTGDGVTTEFQIVRSFGDFTEKVSNINAITAVTLNNTPTSNYTVSNTGVITFNTAPSASAAVRWSGSYFFRCRFTQDASEFENFMYQLWSLGSMEFLANLGTKL